MAGLVAEAQMALIRAPRPSDSGTMDGNTSRWLDGAKLVNLLLTRIGILMVIVWCLVSMITKAAPMSLVANISTCAFFPVSSYIVLSKWFNSLTKLLDKDDLVAADFILSYMESFILITIFYMEREQYKSANTLWIFIYCCIWSLTSCVFVIAHARKIINLKLIFVFVLLTSWLQVIYVDTIMSITMMVVGELDTDIIFLLGAIYVFLEYGLVACVILHFALFIDNAFKRFKWENFKTKISTFIDYVFGRIWKTSGQETGATFERV